MLVVAVLGSTSFATAQMRGLEPLPSMPNVGPSIAPMPPQITEPGAPARVAKEPSKIEGLSPTAPTTGQQQEPTFSPER